MFDLAPGNYTTTGDLMLHLTPDATNGSSTNGSRSQQHVPPGAFVVPVPPPGHSYQAEPLTGAHIQLVPASSEEA